MKQLTTLTLLALVLAVAGCSSDITAGKLHNSMAGDLRTPGKTWNEVDNQIARGIIANKRMGNQDILRLLLLDRAGRSYDSVSTAQ